MRVERETGGVHVSVGECVRVREGEGGSVHVSVGECVRVREGEGGSAGIDRQADR